MKSKNKTIKSLLSASHFYRSFVKDSLNNDWLITRLGACLILGISEHKFHAEFRNAEGFPKPIKKIGNTLYYSMKMIVEFSQIFNKQKGSSLK